MRVHAEFTGFFGARSIYSSGSLYNHYMRKTSNLVKITASITVALLAAFLLASNSNGKAARAYPVDAIREEIGATQIKVMTFNIWIGGGAVDFAKVIDAIKISGADVVGLQEAEGTAPKIAALLGWAYADERLQIISKYPMIQPGDGAGLYTYVQLSPGQVFAMSNIHLPSDPYGPYQINEGADLKTVLKSEEDTRMPVINKFLPTWKRLLAHKIPLVITGDFNSPSYLDWIKSTVGLRPAMKFPVAWPASKSIADLGMVDTYRVIHKDPKKVPGITWTLGYPFPRIDPKEVVDRIDFIWVPTGTKVSGSGIVGPTGGPDVEFGVLPFPSDHLGVVSTFNFDPVEPPPYIATNSNRYEQGDPITVAYHGPLGDADSVAIVKVGDDPLTQAVTSTPPQEAGFFGQMRMGSGNLSPGKYEVALISKDKVVQRSAFWVVTRGAFPTVGTDKSSYSSGSPIQISWKNSFGRKFDWVGIFSTKSTDIYYTQSSFHYTDATVDGSCTVTSSDTGGALPAGEYEVRLMNDDGYVVLTAQKFSVHSKG